MASAVVDLANRLNLPYFPNSQYINFKLYLKINKKYLIGYIEIDKFKVFKI